MLEIFLGNVTKGTQRDGVVGCQSIKRGLHLKE